MSLGISSHVYEIAVLAQRLRNACILKTDCTHPCTCCNAWQLQVGRPVEFGKLLTHIMAITPCEGEPALEPVRHSTPTATALLLTLLLNTLHAMLLSLHEQHCAVQHLLAYA
jgi:hypothetical protein